MKDATSQLRVATRRAKSDVANKLVSMFLHELSRRICQGLEMRVDSEEYGNLVRSRFANRCPYCLCDLAKTTPVVEHLDGMNRYRAGLHVPGNVLVACRKCNSEKRRDDALRYPTLGNFGWESFLSHDGTRCAPSCETCQYWKHVWEDDLKRKGCMAENLQRIRAFRTEFPDLEKLTPSLLETLPDLLGKLYSECQDFAENEIRKLLDNFEMVSAVGRS